MGIRDRRQPVVVIDTAIVSVESHTLGSRLDASGGLERVVGVEFLAQFRATAAGRKEGSVTVLRQGPEAETPTASAQRGLRPLLVVRVEARELLEALPDMVVEAAQSVAMEGRRNSSDRKDHFAEGSAVAEEL